MARSAREVALKILRDIFENGAYSNLSINKNTDYSISTLDDSLIREIVYGVLENKLFIDWVIENFSKIKPDKISPVVKAILRMGVYQIIFTDRIPDSAAVNESVKLAKKNSHKGVHGFVNGVLRNISRQKGKIKLPDKDQTPNDYLSIKYSHPKWMVEKWISEFGFSFTEDLCSANNSKPKINVRTNTLKITRNELIKKLENVGLDVYKTKYAEDGIIIENPTRITELEEYKNGYFQIQDESSMLVAQIMNPKEGSLVVDVCCAPGGKTTHIAQKMNNKGQIIARDIYEHKLELVNENKRRLGISIIETQKYNALDLDENLVGKADYCLVDVPCSGLGLLRRKPDIRWNKNEDNISDLVELQHKILYNSSMYVKDGGFLIYSTCTIEREENINQVKRFLSKNTDFKLVNFCDLLISVESMETCNDGYVELFPNIQSTDGFFIAKMVKI